MPLTYEFIWVGQLQVSVKLYLDIVSEWDSLQFLLGSLVATKAQLSPEPNVVIFAAYTKYIHQYLWAPKSSRPGHPCFGGGSKRGEGGGEWMHTGYNGAWARYIVVQQNTTVSFWQCCQFKVLFISQCLWIKVLTVEIVNFVFYKSCSF